MASAFSSNAGLPFFRSKRTPTCSTSAFAVPTASFPYVLGAGCAPSRTRGSMHDSLSGDTYAGRYIAAEICTGLPHEPEESMIFASHDGFVLLAPLPENHWITFVDLDP